MLTTTPSLYIGRCKHKGCKTAIRVEYRAVQDLTAAQFKAREFDPTGAFMIHGVQPYGWCAEHGAYVIKYLKGRYSEAHECGPKCLNAVGPSCDCQCGGANHGAGHHA